MSTQQSKKMQLIVPLYEQEKSNWCWAACYQMLKMYRDGVTFTQSQIVAATGQGQTNATAASGTILALLNDPEVPITKKGPGEVKILTKMLSEDEICQLITMGSPIMICWKRQAGEHMVIISGWEDLGTPSEKDIRFTVNNPELKSPQIMAYKYLTTAAGKGQWTETIIGF